jgi:phosphoribosylanthranilate isomerase
MRRLEGLQRTRVKICGITRPEDGVGAARLGVDALGLVFYPASARVVDINRAQAVISALPPFVTIVALFMNASREAVGQVIRALPIDLLQFHGEESVSFCESFARPYIKAVPMGSAGDVLAYARRYPGAKALLLDSHNFGMAGGSGETFSWSRVPRNLDRPIILAGGLNPDNVAAGVRALHPYGVDVSSGVESAKGVKDYDLMKRFSSEVRRVDGFGY